MSENMDSGATDTRVSGVVVDFNFYKAIADKLKEQGRTIKDDDLAYRMERIRASIERIDKVMAELRQGPPSKQAKE